MTEFIEDRQQRKLIIKKADILSGEENEETTTETPQGIGKDEKYCLPKNLHLLVLVPYTSLWVLGIISYCTYRSYFG